jgi:hypothetical protein
MVGRGVVASAGTDLVPLAHFIDRCRHPGLAETLGDAVSSRDKENAAGQKTARFEPDAKDPSPRRQNARECQFDNAMMGAYVDAVSLNWELRNQLERQRRASAGLCAQLLEELRTEREHSARIAADAAEQMLAAHWQMEDDAGQIAALAAVVRCSAHFCQKILSKMLLDDILHKPFFSVLRVCCVV